MRPNRHSTRAQVSGHVDRSIESNRNCLPHSGCVGSITSTSEEGKSASAHRAFLSPFVGSAQLAASHARRPGSLRDARPNGDKEAGVRQFTAWGDTDEGGHILIAVARYLAAHSPTERAALQTADIARRLMWGGELHQEARSS